MTDLFSEEEIFFPPQIIAQNHAFKVKVIHTCLSVFCKHTSWKECKCTSLFLRQMHNRGCFCVLFFLLGAMKKEFRSHRVYTKPGMASLGPEPTESMSHPTWAQGPSGSDGESDIPPVKNRDSQCPLRTSPAEQRVVAFRSAGCLEEPFNFSSGAWHSERSHVLRN